MNIYRSIYQKDDKICTRSSSTSGTCQCFSSARFICEENEHDCIIIDDLMSGFHLKTHEFVINVIDYYGMYSYVQ